MFSERPWPTQNEVLEYFNLTISDMIYNGEAITFSSMARKMSVSRSYLYRHPETRCVINYYRTSGMSKAELQNEVTRLRDRLLPLEQKFNDRYCPETRCTIKYYGTSGMSKAELQKEVAQLRDCVLELELKFNERHYIRPFFPQSDAECIQADLGENHANNK